ncbi:molybdenum cofactor biosynthesis protein MoaE [Larkinella humicola]|uniref:Molybdopterin synthase catalytic subunit n=1 Tax=Larkinella humicola TaxID=2607654 RepID=A0A5N1JDT0_9BACT|nr:molybdenum cofactor biosynthesis protein MoaE [Larkinella humicola]KAA9349923.1 molybdenum cofactor biosynthesis protein MoaE [Larkinella humicola]
MVSITTDPIDMNAAYRYVSTDSAGAITFFFGTVRDSTNERAVERLEYEAYDRMALTKMQEIAAEACRRWDVRKYTIIHRKGNLAIGDIAVLIAVATPHRADAFDACRYLIDTLKQQVPIWKKEIFEDGQVWVDAHP